MVKCDYVEGVLSFLQRSAKKYKLFISTGTPTVEIKSILKSRKISHFFHDTYGSPESKFYHIDKILSKYNYKPEELIFFGDSKTDFDAAYNYNIRFILIKNKENLDLQESFDGEKIVHFDELNL